MTVDNHLVTSMSENPLCELGCKMKRGGDVE